uniref:Aldo_ket_red domain-containing protein n=1 Tax=Syphacia muris TaxID=451379 RepID=A0A0N5ACZ1_9BILA
MTVKGPTLKLSSGAEMPQVGLGTWLASDIILRFNFLLVLSVLSSFTLLFTVFYLQSKPNEVGNAVKWALDAGYRLIDTAELYGNEKEIGDALQEYFKAGKIKREDVFITT